jgi:hypothetical protein
MWILESYEPGDDRPWVIGPFESLEEASVWARENLRRRWKTLRPIRPQEWLDPYPDIDSDAPSDAKVIPLRPE